MKKIIILSILALTSCDLHQAKKNKSDDLFIIPNMSKSISVSKKNKVFIESCGVSLIRSSDTIPIENRAWIEYKWIKKGMNIVKTRGVQIVFIADESISNDLRNLEFQDDNYGASARLGKVFSYSLKENLNDTSKYLTELRIVSPKRKGEKLLFQRNPEAE